jgi:CTP synthase
MREEGLDAVVAARLGLPDVPPDLTEWEALVQRVQSAQEQVTVAIVGKYVDLPDAYLSVVESAPARRPRARRRGRVALDRLRRPQPGGGAQPEDEADASNASTGSDGRRWRARPRRLRCPRGRGQDRRDPLGPDPRGPVPRALCLGLQSAVIEFARNVVGLPYAHSSEFEPNSPDPVIDLMHDQREVTDKGGTMRLGSYPAKLTPGTRTRAAYGDEPVIYERHRHRFEVNNRYRHRLEDAGMVFSGVSPDDRLVEFIELPDHPWFVATQAHPELKSRPNRPHPLFDGFVGAALQRRRETSGRLPVVLDQRHGAELDEPTVAELAEAAVHDGGPPHRTAHAEHPGH